MTWRTWGAAGDSITLGYGATNWNGSYAVLAGLPREGRPGQALIHTTDAYPPFLTTIDGTFAAMHAMGIGVMVIEIGVNELQFNTSDGSFKFGYEIVEYKARYWNIKMIYTTITPNGPRPDVTQAMQDQRLRINAWIRTRKHYIDFAAVLGGNVWLPQYDCGDHLHPNDAGHQALAARLTMYMNYHRFKL